MRDDAYVLKLRNRAGTEFELATGRWSCWDAAAAIPDEVAPGQYLVWAQGEGIIRPDEPQEAPHLRSNALVIDVP